MKRFNHMYLICSTLLTFGLLLKFREVNTIFITCIYIYCSASDGLVNATIFQEFLATSDKSEGVTTYNACMTAYTESLAKDKEDGRSIWIDKSGVEVREADQKIFIHLCRAAHLFCSDAGHESPGVWLWGINNSLQSLRQTVDLHRAQQILGRDGITKICC